MKCIQSLIKPVTHTTNMPLSKDLYYTKMEITWLFENVIKDFCELNNMFNEALTDIEEI